MSLTSFLKQSEEVRMLLKQYFPYPLKSVTFPPLQAPPRTRNFALIGQAFDYLLRFSLQRHNPHTHKGTGWIANWIQGTLSGEGEEIQELRGKERAALPFLENAHRHHRQYLEDGRVTDDLLRSCYHLAIIDGLVRAGEMRGALGAVDPRDMQDLRNLLALVPSFPFLSEGPCVLNPVFSFPSGADCDLLVGETLIEIKTTKFSEVKQDYYQQLLGYYLLNLAHEHPFPIKHIGIYFSRHGYLWTVDIKDIASEAVFQEFLPLWEELVECYHDEG